MSKYVVVRATPTQVNDAVTAAGAGLTQDSGIAPITCLGGVEEVNIITFADAYEYKAVPFSLNRPDFDATVFAKLGDAEKNAVARAEGN